MGGCAHNSRGIVRTPLTGATAYWTVACAFTFRPGRGVCSYCGALRKPLPGSNHPRQLSPALEPGRSQGAACRSLAFHLPGRGARRTMDCAGRRGNTGPVSAAG